jgi:Na+-translocating ferredoxin:NAD+ oxidoreductase RnfG subunit
MSEKWFALLALSPAVVLQAHAEVYMSAEKAAALIFPKEVLRREEVQLSEENVKNIEAALGEHVRSKTIIVFKGTAGTVFIDEVIGKHEFITYAVGVDKSGQVTGLEILEYRENYGSEIKQDTWKKQFVGKTSKSSLKIGNDIQKISGATLSSSHVTLGVKRILLTYEHVQKRL